MRTGIIGGAFNPVHCAHLSIAAALLRNCGLDRVIFVPTANPPHKDVAQLAAFAHRFAMVELAVAGFDGFEVSDIEMQREERSYSVHTLQDFHRQYPDDSFYFLLGRDSLLSLHSWYNYTDIFELCHLVVADRPVVGAEAANTAVPVAIRQHFCYDSTLKTLCHGSGNQLIFLPEPGEEVSATDIRNKLVQKQDVSGLVPSVVLEYIALHRLYADYER